MLSLCFACCGAGGCNSSIYDLCVDNMDMIIKDGEEVLRYRDKKQEAEK